MRKISQFKDPFLYGAIVDLVGAITVFFILYFNNIFGEYLFSTILLYIPIILATSFRGIFTVASFNILAHLRVLRVIAFNINIDIKVTRILIARFGNRKIYQERLRLLKEKKRKTKQVYISICAIIAFFWREGYNSEAILFVLEKMKELGADIVKLDGKYKT